MAREWQELDRTHPGSAGRGRARAASAEGHRRRRQLRAAAARPPRCRRPGLRRRLRAQPRLDQGDGARLRRQLPHDQGAAEPHRRAPRIRRHRSRGPRRATSSSGSRAASSPPKRRSPNWRDSNDAAASCQASDRYDADGRRLRLWLPLFLFWLIVLPFVIVALPVVIVILALMRRRPLRRHRRLLARAGCDLRHRRRAERQARFPRAARLLRRHP